MEHSVLLTTRGRCGAELFTAPNGALWGTVHYLPPGGAMEHSVLLTLWCTVHY